MPTRYKTDAKRKFGQAPLPSGYDAKDVPQDFTIPPVGIKDVDTALFYLFDREIPIQVLAPDTETGAAVMKDVPIVFAGGEKWAMIKKGRAPRDKNGSLVLPLITMGRKNITQTPNEDISGRGINQQTGELIIRRRLDRSDRSYQNLINRLLLKNQENVAVEPTDGPVEGQVETTREIGDRSDELTIEDGGLLMPNRRNNVWETIVIPAPQFFTVQYDIIIWSQYDTQMNQILEQLVSSFLPQGNAWRLDARDDKKIKKGYWFVATVDGNLYTAQNNYDDMSTQERLIKYEFTINVPAYVLASATPGAPVPIRRYVSVPSIEFSVSTDLGLSETTEPSVGIDDPFLGSDDPTLPLSNDPTATADQRRDGTTRLYPNRISEHDPALENLPRGVNPARYRKITGINHRGETVCRYVKIKTVNKHSGETVYAADTDLGGLKIVLVDD
jgi:hypothetical protein